jgi:hypothetical protein
MFLWSIGDDYDGGAKRKERDALTLEILYIRCSISEWNLGFGHAQNLSGYIEDCH